MTQWPPGFVFVFILFYKYLFLGDLSTILQHMYIHMQQMPIHVRCFAFMTTLVFQFLDSFVFPYWLVVPAQCH